jgi:hypothetical protein
MQRRLLVESLFIFAMICTSAQDGHAGMSSFIDGCVAHVRDFSRLGAHLEASGMKEIDPDQGPRLLIGSGSPQRQRLWQTMPVPAGMIDAFTGYAIDNVNDLPVEICFHVSRPGESAAVALADLKYRYPPVGDTRADTLFFYGGIELWDTRIDGVTATVGVAWAFKSQPRDGTSMLYLVKPRERVYGGLR